MRKILMITVLLALLFTVSACKLSDITNFFKPAGELEAVIQVHCPGCIKQRAGYPPLHVILDGSTSRGKIDAYIWKIGGEETGGMVVNHIFTKPGLYQIELTVTGTGREDTATTFIRVLEETTNVREYTESSKDVTVTVIVPSSVGLGDHFLIELIIEVKRDLNYLEVAWAMPKRVEAKESQLLIWHSPQANEIRQIKPRFECYGSFSGPTYISIFSQGREGRDSWGFNVLIGYEED